MADDQSVGNRNQSNNASHTSLKLFTGIILGTIGVAVLLRTDTIPRSLSALSIGLSSLFGLLAGIADHIEPLRHGFEWARWLIVGLAVLFLLAAVQNYFTLPILISLALGLSSGILVSTIGIIISQLLSQ